MAENTPVKNQRRTQLQIIEDKRNELAEAIKQNEHLLKVLPVKKQEQFRENFLELATQDYLISIIEPKELIRFSVNVAKIGLNINPAYKEVYIVPFNTKVNGTKVMLPQAIIPLNGMQEMAYSKNFFLKLNAVYKIGKEYMSEEDITRAQQAQINTSDPKWVDEHFTGFDVLLIDLEDKLPKQVKFVEKPYLIEVTKTIQDQRFKLQTWRHKAVRRGIGDMFMPRNRAIEAFEKLEHLNDLELQKADKNTTVETTIVAKPFEELKLALEPLNLTIAYKDGYAIASGDTYNHQKTLNSLGFKYVNGEFKAPAETPKNNSSDDNTLTETLAEYGLSIIEKTVKGKVYQIVEGETMGLDKVLTEHGFTKGQTGNWGKEKGLF